MEQVYIDTLNRLKNEGLAGIIAYSKYQFDIKYEEGILYFSKVIDKDTKESLVSDIHSVPCSLDILEQNLDKLVNKFIEKYIYTLIPNYD